MSCRAIRLTNIVTRLVLQYCYRSIGTGMTSPFSLGLYKRQAIEWYDENLPPIQCRINFVQNATYAEDVPACENGRAPAAVNTNSEQVVDPDSEVAVGNRSDRSSLPACAILLLT